MSTKRLRKASALRMDERLLLVHQIWDDGSTSGKSPSSISRRFRRTRGSHRVA